MSIHSTRSPVAHRWVMRSHWPVRIHSPDYSGSPMPARHHHCSNGLWNWPVFDHFPAAIRNGCFVKRGVFGKWKAAPGDYHEALASPDAHETVCVARTPRHHDEESSILKFREPRFVAELDGVPNANHRRAPGRVVQGSYIATTVVHEPGPVARAGAKLDHRMAGKACDQLQVGTGVRIPTC